MAGEATATSSRTGRSTRSQRVDAEFSAYMEARHAALLRTAYLLCGDLATAEDLVQGALAKLYLGWDKVTQRESVDAYCRRIIVNDNNSLWRRAFKRRELVTDQPPERPSYDEVDTGVGERIWARLKALPPRQRSVVVLRYYEQLSEAEIADALGISTGTVKSTASRALANLRLQDWEEER